MSLPGNQPAFEATGDCRWWLVLGTVSFAISEPWRRPKTAVGHGAQAALRHTSIGMLVGPCFQVALMSASGSQRCGCSGCNLDRLSLLDLLALASPLAVRMSLRNDISLPGLEL